MIQKFDRNDRRILKFPAVHPCEGISPATLLESLINLSHEICSYQSKFFATQRKNAREMFRQISILSMFFEDIREHVPNLLDSAVLCFSELHLTFQKIQFLLEDCTCEGARIWILMKAYFVSNQFRDLIRAVATALDVLPLGSIDVSSETKELVELLSKQARKVKMELDAEDENAMKRVILILNQFENKFEPEPCLIKKIVDYLDIRTWADCHREIKFLDKEITLEFLKSDAREVPLLSSLVGFLNYCRAVLFEDCDFGDVDQSEVKTNLEMLTCLNPKDFQCPISLELMTDPVTISTGQTYDRASIQKWLKSGNFICPKTQEMLTSTELVPNTSLRNVIQQFCAEYGISLSKSRTKNRDISRTISPGSPSYAEAMKFVSKFLVSRLYSGSGYQKNKAAYEIRLLTKSNIFNRSCLIEAGTISPLVKLLTSTDPSTQENAISALLKLSKHSTGQKGIIQNGGLKFILGLVKDGLKLETRQIAVATVFYLSSVDEYRKLIGDQRETIPSLLEIIKEGTTCGKKNAVVAIFGLLLYKKNHQRVLEAGTVPLLLELLVSSSDRSQLKTDTLAVLATLAESINGSIAIMQASGLTLIVKFLQSITSKAGKEYCVSILHSLCINCGVDVVSVLAKDEPLMSALYALLTEGTSHASRKARSLIKILQKFCEASSSRLIREVRQEQFVDVR
ncbi:U-box domain-containing protein 18 [Abeliophyllum distichum]|uniref:RING-type E3 ubiquitin transferase n=1 Tax=Abeliophyllum distichum TaxID=126358 RepID=A0ABD1RWB3_9LAMI